MHSSRVGAARVRFRLAPPYGRATRVSKGGCSINRVRSSVRTGENHPASHDYRTEQLSPWFRCKRYWFTWSGWNGDVLALAFPVESQRGWPNAQRGWLEYRLRLKRCDWCQRKWISPEKIKSLFNMTFMIKPSSIARFVQRELLVACIVRSSVPWMWLSEPLTVHVQRSSHRAYKSYRCFDRVIIGSNLL